MDLCRLAFIEMHNFLYKKFKTKNNYYIYYYIYDSATNHIFRVNEIIFSIIDDVLKEEKVAYINEKFSKKWKKETIIRAVENIKVYQKKGHFTSEGPKKLSILSFKELIHKLNHELYQLTLGVTEKCNLNCYYCVYSEKFGMYRKHSKRNMSYMTALKAVEFYLNRFNSKKFPIITFYGGEPLINFALIEKIVKYIKNNFKFQKIYFGITTNGTLLNENIINFLIKNGFNIKISLDGPQEIHDRYRIFRKGKGTFDIIIKNLEKIRKFSEEYLYSKVGFNVVITPSSNLEKLEEFFEKFPFIRKHNKLKCSYVVTHESSLTFPIDEIQKFRVMINRIREKYISNIIHNDKPTILSQALFEKSLLYLYKRRLFKKFSNEHPPNGICIPGVRNLYVDCDGRFYICEKMEDFEPIGDLENGFNYDKIYSLLNKYVELNIANCKNCWAIRLCKLCFTSIKQKKRLDIRIRKKFCERHRARLLNDLISYMEIVENNRKALDYMKNIVI